MACLLAIHVFKIVFKTFYYLNLYIHVCVWVCAHECRLKSEELDALELEIQIVVGLKLRPSGRAVHVFNHWTISLASV